MKIIKANIEDSEAIVQPNKQFHLNIFDFKWDTLDWIQKEINKGDYYIL